MLPILLFAVFVLASSTAAVRTKKLTPLAGATGAVVAACLFAGTGWAGIGLLAAFFLLGTAATGWKRNAKASLGMSGQLGERRTAAQVLANGGVTGALGLFAYFLPPYQPLCFLLVACALSAATADTVSSELGTVYGRRFYNITNFGKGRRGADGVISIEGTLFGLAGSLCIAALYAPFGSPATAWIVVAAGTVGNLADSYMGAVLERRGLLGNNAVNLLNTAAGAVTGWLLV